MSQLKNKPRQVEGPCHVCSVNCSLCCATCRKAFYCSVEHQKSHRKEHKTDCFPAKLEFSQDFGGRCFLASRDISPGEVIFKDKALISGPSGAETYFHIICLGCYQSVKGSYKCSSCGWSVCSAKCEKIPHHANNECKIFREAQVEPSILKPYQYDFINFLRCLLLRDHANNLAGESTADTVASQYKQNWTQLQSLESHSKPRAKNRFAVRLLHEATQFIQETCKLGNKFEPELIDHVVGVWTINSFGANPPAGVKPGHARMATLLFPKLCLAAHNCIPNTQGILQEEMKSGKPVYTMQLIASLPIGKGEQIHTSYANVCEGTVERREILQDHYYFSCKCKRCSSQTEFGTYFSSLKCPSCVSGYLVSSNPLDNEALWKCEEDGCVKSKDGMKYAEFVSKINRIRKEINAAEMEFKIEDCLMKYEEILDVYKGKLLHPNHWLVIETEFKLMLRLVSYLSTVRTNKEEQSEILTKLIELAEHCLGVADSIQCGLNSYRGKILFCLVEGKLKQFIRSTSKQSLVRLKDLRSLKNYAEEAIGILHKEQGLEEKQVTVMLMQHVKTIEEMIQTFSSHKKNSFT